MRFPIRTPFFVPWLYPEYLWRVKTNEKVIYLTFDDGPHPTITPFVLEALQKVNAKATFFCIGKNVAANPGVYADILSAGHAVGNHTENHLNGWQTADEVYLKDIQAAGKRIDSKWFRPPYGKISRFQAAQLPVVLQRQDVQVVMWDILSYDFQTSLSAENCWEMLAPKVRKGSIIVFHDSEKAFPRLREVLPKLLTHFTDKGFVFSTLGA